MSGVVYRSQVRIERVKGPVRRAYLPGEAQPVVFGVHGAVAEHYKREAVAAGLGVSVVSRHAVRPGDPRVVALRFQGRRCMRDLLVIRRPGAPLSPAAARLRELLLRGH